MNIQALIWFSVLLLRRTDTIMIFYDQGLAAYPCPFAPPSVDLMSFLRIRFAVLSSHEARRPMTWSRW